MVNPEISGMEMEEAIRALYSLNILDINLQLTSPGPGYLPQGKLRAIRGILAENGKINVIVAFENYLKGGV